MQNTCNNCNHWSVDSTAVKQDNFGECDVLSSTDSGMKYVLPVIQQAEKTTVGMVTSGDFGCNQFAAA